MFSAHSFGTVEKDYAPQADDGLLTIVQIESRSAVENVEEIAKVDGIDILFIGMSTLSPTARHHLSRRHASDQEITARTTDRR